MTGQRPEPSLTARAAAEALATALLVMAVVGSGIMGDRLSAGNTGVALLANSLATGAALVAIILAFGGVSGAHLNPVVSLVAVYVRELPLPAAGTYIAAQIAGALVGVVCSNTMFGEPAIQWSHHTRDGSAQFLSEIVATFGLVSIVIGTARARPNVVAFAVGAYILAAYWFTASTAFANPAVTIARALTDTFTGIRPGDVPAFVVAQAVGAAGAAVLGKWLFRAGAVAAAQPGQPAIRGVTDATL